MEGLIKLLEQLKIYHRNISLLSLEKQLHYYYGCRNCLWKNVVVVFPAASVLCCCSVSCTMWLWYCLSVVTLLHWPWLSFCFFTHNESSLSIICPTSQKQYSDYTQLRTERQRNYSSLSVSLSVSVCLSVSLSLSHPLSLFLSPPISLWGENKSHRNYSVRSCLSLSKWTLFIT